MKIRIHNKFELGDGGAYYVYSFYKLKFGHYYWVGDTFNQFKTLLRIGNYVLGLQVSKTL